MGVAYLLLSLVGAAGALVLAWRFGLGVAATAATLLPTAAPGYLAWRALQGQPVAPSLPEAADRVARAVKKRWGEEERFRRVHDPYPLPVAWEAAAEDLLVPWSQLIERAGPPGDDCDWPASAAGLAGSDGQIGQVFTDRVPTRRLVVLGEPGAGKSVLLIRLLQDLISRRLAGAPVPVLFSLASWDPVDQGLEGWLADQLRRAHPGLTAIAEADTADLAQAMLDAELILPLLDGFDELPTAVHAVALDAINQYLSAARPLVLAARTAAYRATLDRPGTLVRLNAAAGISLLPLTRDQSAAYLRRNAGHPDSPAAARWDTVIYHLGTRTPVAQALSTPLGLFLARTI
ncbi:NACHT domain-containing protein [Streptomyces sp. YC504]|uniref:NACHT domain-containing protein n=1 Tax=Streptomyces mesophilus TaxID=1775132 RepID=A0A6G4XXI8_9ACTN|nr:NACHT domain-containing protein [Streptomyces mesophilus]